VITSILTNVVRAVVATTPADLLPLVYLCTDHIAPAHTGLELGVGDSSLIKALSLATGRKESAIKSDYDKVGDIGAVAAASRATQKTMFTPPPLTVAGVYRALLEIAAAEGAKSQDRKRGMIVKLLAAAKQHEAGYIMRKLQGKLRIGLAERTVLTALAHGAALQLEAAGDAGSSENVANALERASQVVKQVYSECPSYEEMIPALLECRPMDVELPKRVHFKVGVPVKPMLANATRGVGEVLEKFAHQPFTCEYKYDGERAQVHVMEGGKVMVSGDDTGCLGVFFVWGLFVSFFHFFFHFFSSFCVCVCVCVVVVVVVVVVVGGGGGAASACLCVVLCSLKVVHLFPFSFLYPLLPFFTQ
jgi:DNA ligase 1